ALAGCGSALVLCGTNPSMVPLGTIVKGAGMSRRSASQDDPKDGGESAVRARILEAAFAAFMKQGYAATSTAEIAARAKVSKRELYAIGNKQELLAACISARARRLQV